MLSQVIQLPVLQEQDVTGKPVIGCRLQPLQRLFRLVHHCIGAGDVIGRVVEVPEPLPRSIASLALLSYTILTV